MLNLLVIAIFAFAAVVLFYLKRRLYGFGAGSLCAVAIAFMVLSSYKITPTGIARVSTFQGVVVKSWVLQPGSYQWAPPIFDYYDVSVMPRSFDVVGGEGKPVKFMSKEKMILETSVNFGWAVNKLHADVVYSLFKGVDGAEATVKSICLIALRDAAAELPWQDSSTDNRPLFQQKIHDKEVSEMSARLNGMGVDKKIADQVFIFLPPNVMECLPPERVQTEISEQQAALSRLIRQKTLTLIEKEVALQKEQSGAGIQNLMHGAGIAVYTADDVQKILYADAAIMQAGALTKAVENGKIDHVNFSQATPFTLGPAQAPTEK